MTGASRSCSRTTDLVDARRELDGATEVFNHLQEAQTAAVKAHVALGRLEGFLKGAGRRRVEIALALNSALAINLPPVAHGVNDDSLFADEDLVDHPVVADSELVHASEIAFQAL